MALQPLAERLRPRTLDGYIGQQHLVGPKGIIRRMIDTGNIASFILWGPPGVGKTTLARIIANTTNSAFFTLSAVTSGVKDVRDVIEKASRESSGMFSSGRPILFIDEIHRFSKSQQDSLLGAVENGTVTLIGATTENPSFEVIRVEQTDALFRYAGGDARKLLNILDLLQQSTVAGEDIVINDRIITERLQENPQAYDKNGDMHYDIISAFIKSIRGSDPDAAVYWLARMIAGGEDPEFIARRMVILASEDIGLANPNAMLIANATFDIIQKIGMPEGRIPLSECAIYLAQSAKSNSAYLAIDAALAEVERSGNLPVPLHLRNAPTSLMKKLGYGQNYMYAHDYPGNFIQQQFLPDALAMRTFWHPCTNPAEDVMTQRTEARWNGFGKKR